MLAVPPVVPSVVPPVVPSVVPQVVPSVGYYTLGVQMSALETPKAHDLRGPRCSESAAPAAPPRMKIPSAFSAAYPGCPVTLVNRENVADFVTD